MEAAAFWLLGTVIQKSGFTEHAVRHPPQSGWLDEWGYLKGSRPVGFGVALKRALVVDSQNCPAPSASSCSRM